MLRTAAEVTDPASRPAGKKTLTWKFKCIQTRDVAWASFLCICLGRGKNESA
jgi:hypothetical protein